ncbi:hypothetical protein BTVI_03149 [Pitangus sulphuratus]|nr:hypothetical protein BTVI_03149 [Pitangus sulphuratus]
MPIHRDDKKVIRSTQHGFTERKSSLTNPVTFYNEKTTRVNKGREVDIVYLNFSKAFNTVSHNIFIEKLSGAKQEDKGQQTETDAQEVPSNYEEQLLYCGGDCMLERIAQGGCGVALTREIQELSGPSPTPCALG